MAPSLFFVTAILLATSAQTAAIAQDQYRLADDDTWLATETHDPATPEGQLSIARRALAAGDEDRAEHLASQWIERHKRHPLLAEAYLLRGDALKARRDYYEALFDYEYIARMCPGSEAFVTALERELEIAKLFAGGTKRKLWGLRFLDASDEAEELLIRIQERLPGSQLAEDAALTLGDFYFTRRKMDLAAELYAIFIENFPRSQHIDTARKRLIYAHLASFKGPQFDAAGLYEARACLRELKATAPAMAQQMGADALLTRIDESDASKLLETARWHRRTGDFIAAELTIRRLVRKYPQSVATRQAMHLIGEVLPQLPERIVIEAPDYEKLRTIILGEPQPPAGEPADEETTPASEPSSEGAP